MRPLHPLLFGALVAALAAMLGVEVGWLLWAS